MQYFTVMHRFQVVESRHHSAQKIAIGDAAWRTVIQGADAHIQDLAGGACGLRGDQVDQVWVELPSGRTPVPSVAMRSRSITALR